MLLEPLSSFPALSTRSERSHPRGRLPGSRGDLAPYVRPRPGEGGRLRHGRLPASSCTGGRHTRPRSAAAARSGEGEALPVLSSSPGRLPRPRPRLGPRQAPRNAAGGHMRCGGRASPPAPRRHLALTQLQKSRAGRVRTAAGVPPGPSRDPHLAQGEQQQTVRAEPGHRLRRRRSRWASPRPRGRRPPASLLSLSGPPLAAPAPRAPPTAAA